MRRHHQPAMLRSFRQPAQPSDFPAQHIRFLLLLLFRQRTQQFSLRHSHFPPVNQRRRRGWPLRDSPLPRALEVHRRGSFLFFSVVGSPDRRRMHFLTQNQKVQVDQPSHWTGKGSLPHTVWLGQANKQLQLGKPSSFVQQQKSATLHARKQQHHGWEPRPGPAKTDPLESRSRSELDDVPTRPTNRQKRCWIGKFQLKTERSWWAWVCWLVGSGCLEELLLESFVESVETHRVVECEQSYQICWDLWASNEGLHLDVSPGWDQLIGVIVSGNCNGRGMLVELMMIWQVMWSCDFKNDKHNS